MSHTVASRAAATYQGQELEQRPVPFAGGLLGSTAVLHVARVPRATAATPSPEGAAGSYCLILVAGAGRRPRLPQVAEVASLKARIGIQHRMQPGTPGNPAAGVRALSAPPFPALERHQRKQPQTA
jgi:hypothetical protein